MQEKPDCWKLTKYVDDLNNSWSIDICELIFPFFFPPQQKDQNPAECKQQWSSVYVALRITCTVIA